MRQMSLSMNQKHTDMEDRLALTNKEWGWGSGGRGERREWLQTSIHRMDKLQGPTV